MRHLLYLLLLLLLVGCTDNAAISSVPIRPVQLSIDTRSGMYVHFTPDNIGSIIVVDPQGYHFNGQTLPLTHTDFYGYAGVVIAVTNDIQHPYAAFDLCCPHCLLQFSPCAVDGFFLTCPTCGEIYDISFGYGIPIKGISREQLKRYSTLYSNFRLTVRN